MSKSMDKRKQSIYIPADLLHQVELEAARCRVPLSRVIQDCIVLTFRHLDRMDEDPAIWSFRGLLGKKGKKKK